jgi:uncharacterized ferritin-like protein (DUF455 family)
MDSWAMRVLCGTTRADKLSAPPTSLGAGGPPPQRPPPALPDAPGRPAELAFPTRSPKVPFPGPRELGTPRGRGVALHFFANHELLALELMALALLRFPEAPAAFRAGIVAVMRDEQRHLSAYLARMDACGVALGEVPVNRAFWDALAGVDDPLRFLAGLSLTFEQANLDFASYYARAFREAGDDDTAAVIDTVLADEIRHVRHGLAWFDRWRDPRLDRWEALVGALPPPLTPARARGTAFAREARLAAGLDDAFCDRLAVYGASRGRPPRVHAFLPGVERHVAEGDSGRTAVPDPRAAGVEARVAADLAGSAVFLASREDVVLMPRAPTPAFLAGLADAGFDLPEIVEGDPWDAARVLSGRTLGGLAPWGPSPAVADAWAPLRAQVSGPAGAPAGAIWDPRWSALYDKSWSAGVLRDWLRAHPDHGPGSLAGVGCRTWPDVQSAVARPLPDGAVAWVLKAPFATAGRGIRILGAAGEALRRGCPPPPQDRPTDDDRAWAEAVLSTQGCVLVEPWLERVVDLSVQFDVSGDGAVRVHPWGRFLADGRGRYRGAVLGRVLEDLGPDARRAVAEAAPALADVARHVGGLAASLGFAGPAGIDAFVYRAGDGRLACKPLVELNPRATMGRVARAIGRRVSPVSVGLWVQVPRARVRRAGFDGIAAWGDALHARAPVRLGPSGLLTGGVLFTTDPARAQDLVTVLSVAPTRGAAEAQLAP